MDTTMDILAFLGTFASLYGAYVAWRQAGVAKTAAELANRVITQLKSHRKTSDLSELSFHLESTRKVFIKYGSSAPSSLAGANYSEDAEVALNFIHKLKSFRDYFSSDDENVADRLFDEISLEVDKFKSAKSTSYASKSGNSILKKLAEFTPTLKKELNTQKESFVN